MPNAPLSIAARTIAVLVSCDNMGWSEAGAEENAMTTISLPNHAATFHRTVEREMLI